MNTFLVTIGKHQFIAKANCTQSQAEDLLIKQNFSRDRFSITLFDGHEKDAIDLHLVKSKWRQKISGEEFLDFVDLIRDKQLFDETKRIVLRKNPLCKAIEKHIQYTYNNDKCTFINKREHHYLSANFFQIDNVYIDSPGTFGDDRFGDLGAIRFCGNIFLEDESEDIVTKPFIIDVPFKLFLDFDEDEFNQFIQQELEKKREQQFAEARKTFEKLMDDFPELIS